MEVCVVVAIIALLGSASLPALRSVLQSKSVARGAYDLAGLLEFARSEAVARQTYVWVGAENEAGDAGSNLAFSAVYSRDGSANNTDVTNLAPLTRTVQIPSALLSKWSDLTPKTRALVSETPASLAGSTAGITFQLGGRKFAGQTLTFTPGGEVLLKGKTTVDDGYLDRIDVSFRQTRPDGATPSGDEASVLILGSTGAVRVIRVH